MTSPCQTKKKNQKSAKCYAKAFAFCYSNNLWSTSKHQHDARGLFSENFAPFNQILKRRRLIKQGTEYHAYYSACYTSMQRRINF